MYSCHKRQRDQWNRVERSVTDEYLYHQLIFFDKGADVIEGKAFSTNGADQSDTHLEKMNFDPYFTSAWVFKNGPPI